MKSQASILIGVVFAPFYLCAALFLVEPSAFFWRAWEYHRAVGFHHEEHRRWEGRESSDLSRSNLFYYSESWPTTVTIDAYGFRSVPRQADQFEVAVYGDSMIWGSGLSDDQTLPWQLAELWNRSVFNGSRTRMQNIVNHPQLADVRVFLHLISEATAKARNVALVSAPDPSKFQPLTKKGRSTLTTLIRNPGWWSPWAHTARLAERSVEDLRLLWGDVVLGVEPRTQLFMPYDNCRADVEAMVRKIKRNDAVFSARGIRYAFIVVPTKKTVVGERVGNPPRRCNLDYLNRLMRRLREERIATVDLTPALAATADPFMAYDTHWTASGVRSAALAIVEQLSRDGVVSPR
jgi:hypothetical protein